MQDASFGDIVGKDTNANNNDRKKCHRGCKYKKHSSTNTNRINTDIKIQRTYDRKKCHRGFQHW